MVKHVIYDCTHFEKERRILCDRVHETWTTLDKSVTPLHKLFEKKNEPWLLEFSINCSIRQRQGKENEREIHEILAGVGESEGSRAPGAGGGVGGREADAGEAQGDTKMTAPSSILKIS